MSRLALDASVVIKLFFAERHSAECAEAIGEASELVAPDLLWAEAADVVWKRHLRGEVSRDEAADILGKILLLPVRTIPSEQLAHRALDLAIATRRTVYDSLYLAAAIQEGCRLLTADERLFNALSAGPLAGQVLWVGQAKP